MSPRPPTETRRNRRELAAAILRLMPDPAAQTIAGNDRCAQLLELSDEALSAGTSEIEIVMPSSFAGLGLEITPAKAALPGGGRRRS